MPLHSQYDIVIVGGGASGLMAGIAAARKMNRPGRILVAEHGQRTGKKLLSTGNGRCNLTNLQAKAPCYYGAPPEFTGSVLKQFTPADTIAFFASIGLLCREEIDGRVYPYSGQASAVLDLLRNELGALGGEELCSCRIEAIKPRQKGFVLLTDAGGLHTRKLIMATGGRALPSSGSDGSGYELMHSLRHSVTPVFPALVQIKTSPAAVRGLKGIRCSGSVTLLGDGKALKSEAGEIQFTENGLSGICTFQLSRLVGEYLLYKTVSAKKYKKIELALDLVPEHTENALYSMLCERAGRLAQTPAENFLVGILNKRVGQAVLKASGLSSLSVLSGELRADQLLSAAHIIKDWRFTPLGTLSWNDAQVTAGGVPSEEFFAETLESKKMPGLYAAGELLDVDGPCGGYNLQWAWSSGYLAGNAAAASVLAELGE